MSSLASESLANRAAIVGIGATDFSKDSGRSELRLAAEADPALLALLAFDADLAEVDFRRALYLDRLQEGTGDEVLA